MNLRNQASGLIGRAAGLIEQKTGYRLPGRFRAERKPNALEGFVLGVAGANLGLLAMTLYQDYAAKPIFDASPEADKAPSGSLDDISVVGRQHEEGESSTAAVGRKALEAATGEGPRTDAVATALSYGVHWGFGMLAGGLYGALRAGKGSGGDIGVGLAYGVGLWAIADELVVPVLGLQEGPTKSPKTTHANRLAAHLLFGAGLAVGTQAVAAAWKHSRPTALDRFWNFEEEGLEEVD